jgi:hypothetical protein
LGNSLQWEERSTFDGTVADVPKYTAFVAGPTFKGDIEYVPLFAGESSSLVNDIKPAAQIVRDSVREAEEV